MLTVITSCSNNDKDTSEISTQTETTESKDSSPQQSESKQDYHTVNTVMGDVEIPINPQRVVVNWYIGDVIASGLNVVGYYCWAQQSMPFYDEMIKTTKIEKWEPEEVLSLEPDLIITYSKDDFEKFSKVAPVLVIEESMSDTERVRFIGEVTGNSDTANKNIEIFETKLADAKEVFNKDAFDGKTFSIMEDWGSSGEWSGIGYETGSRGGKLIYTYLELEYPSKLAELIQSSGEGRGTISYETAHEYFGDYILWCRQEGKESEYAQTEIWKSIPAVAENRVLEIPGEYQGLFYYSDVLSLSAQLDYIIEALNLLVE